MNFHELTSNYINGKSVDRISNKESTLTNPYDNSYISHWNNTTRVSLQIANHSYKKLGQNWPLW